MEQWVSAIGSQTPTSPIRGNRLLFEPVGPGEHLGDRHPELLRHLLRRARARPARPPAPGPRARDARLRARARIRSATCPGPSATTFGAPVALVAQRGDARGGGSGIGVERLAARADVDAARRARLLAPSASRSRPAARLGGSSGAPAARVDARRSRSRARGRSRRSSRPSTAESKASATVAPRPRRRRPRRGGSPTATRAGGGSGGGGGGAGRPARRGSSRSVTRSAVTSATVRCSVWPALDLGRELRGRAATPASTMHAVRLRRARPRAPRRSRPRAATARAAACAAAARRGRPGRSSVRSIAAACAQADAGRADYPGQMDRGLYIAASGMLAEQIRQDQIANDLANASTPGYKADRTAQREFGELLLANRATGAAVGAQSHGRAGRRRSRPTSPPSRAATPASRWTSPSSARASSACGRPQGVALHAQRPVHRLARRACW